MSQFPTRNCPLCDFTTKRTTTLEKHIKDLHDKEPVDVYVDAFHEGIRPLCKCGCNTRIEWKGWKHGLRNDYIRGHNGQLSSLSKDEAERIKDKRRKTLKDGFESKRITHWATGKTKATDACIARAAETRSKTVKQQFESGERKQWSKGLTKDTDERLKAYSERQKERFESGILTPWAKGLTKETDERVKKMALNVKNSVSDPLVQQRLSTIKMLDIKEVSRRICLLDSGLKFVGSLNDYVGINDETLKFQCRKCKDTSHASLYSMHSGCRKCNPTGSKQENQIKRFISSLGFNPLTTRSVIKPYELDIYIKEKKFAIEFNGLYWHSELQKDKHYHALKTELAAQQGIRLLHIFEDEWNDRKYVIKSMIKARLGLTKKLDARKCSVIMLDKEPSRYFFSQSHVDGYTRATITWGLVCDDKIVAALSLRQPHHNSLRKKYYEIARFACIPNCTVRGALGKLVKIAKQHASNDNKQLLTYVDQRHGDGHGYEAVGFKKQYETQERFWWTDCIHRYDRFTFKADKKRGLTEQIVADESGMIRIFGCKNSVYVL